MRPDPPKKTGVLQSSTPVLRDRPPIVHPKRGKHEKTLGKGCGPGRRSATNCPGSFHFSLGGKFWSKASAAASSTEQPFGA